MFSAHTVRIGTWTGGGLSHPSEPYQQKLLFPWAEVLRSLVWSCPCQQYTVTQDFICSLHWAKFSIHLLNWYLHFNSEGTKAQTSRKSIMWSKPYRLLSEQWRFALNEVCLLGSKCVSSLLLCHGTNSLLRNSPPSLPALQPPSFPPPPIPPASHFNLALWENPIFTLNCGF